MSHCYLELLIYTYSDKMSMPLYSTDDLSNFGKNDQAGPVYEAVPGKEVFPEFEDDSPWFYLFTYRSKADKVSKKLQERFQTFIHKTVVYNRRGKNIIKEEKPSVSGLIFVRGDCCDAIQKFLDTNFPGMYLVRDYYTKRTVSIPHRVMLPFMRISQLSADRIRFMPNSFGYYSSGHTLVTVTSGVLAGLEGYVVRIAREKRLVISVGSMTVAISRVSKETFENAEEYIKLRKQQQNDASSSNFIHLTPRQMEIDSCFFQPENRIDILAIARSLDKWITQAKFLVKDGKYSEAIDITMFILEEIGCRILHEGRSSNMDKVQDIIANICNEIILVLATMEESAKVPTAQKERIVIEKQSLVIRFPFLPISD